MLKILIAEDEEPISKSDSDESDQSRVSVCVCIGWKESGGFDDGGAL